MEGAEYFEIVAAGDMAMVGESVGELFILVWIASGVVALYVGGMWSKY